jgi:capsular exopolysaccharide synthesis family protein
MEILVKDQEGGGAASDIAGAFSSLGLISSNTSVYNELISLLSPAVMSDVVEKLNLDICYTEKKLPRSKTLYGSNLPMQVSFPDLDKQQGASFRMDVNPDGSARLYKFQISTPDGKVKYKEEVKLAPGFQSAKTPIGTILFTSNPRYEAPKGKAEEPKKKTYMISKLGLQTTIEHYATLLKGELADKDAEVIDLSIKDVSTERAVDILNTVLEVYNNKWIDDKNKIAIATSNFIDERLAVIQQELGDVDSDISEYKSKTMIPDLEEAAKLSLQGTHDLDKEILEANNQLAMAQYVKDYVNNSQNTNRVIPVVSGQGNTQLDAQITSYNNVLMTRNNLATNSSTNNPLVAEYDSQLKGMREAIVKAINNQVVNLQATLRNAEGAKGSLQSQLQASPTQAKHLLSIERQQMVKQSLYLYLLQKREENELTQTFTANNIRIITPPMGSLKPVSPKKGMLMAVAFIIGLLIPGAYIYMIMISDNKVRNRKDLKRMTTPFVGEIPFFGHKKRFEWLTKHFEGKKKKHKLEQVTMAVSSGSRDLLNESFRVIRGSIDFMMNKHEDENVIMLTSFNAGSGKSFISYNIAASFAIKGKKVMVVDCDLRHGSTSQFVNMPSKGLSNYLTGATSDWKSLIVPVKGVDNMTVMPIGHRPPNPAELLDNERLGDLLQEMSAEYDYVFLDCPPVDIVVDTQIIEKYVHRTIFVVRAGLLEKAAIPEIDAIYESNRFKHMSVILNCTPQSETRYGTYGSSYYGSNYEVD